MTDETVIRAIIGTGERRPGPDTKALEMRLQVADKPGEHLWVYMGAWHCKDPRQMTGVQLDAGNLLNISGPGCLKCGEPFSNRAAKRPCRGTADQ